MLARGESTGVFQFESSGMRDALRLVKPTEFEDLIALVALYRPGPMGYIPIYGKRKHGGEQVTFLDDRLKPITEPTYGICIYQEQYMEIAKQLAGFSPAEADDLRKAIGKKIHKLMASLKDKFLEGCAANGVTPGVATQLWKDMEQAQDYSFNKSHAACYGLIAYRTAYLRAHWPAEYMAALISSVMSTKDRVPFYVAACDDMGIEVEPPDVNVSVEDFRVVEGRIRFGLNAVKNVGESAVRSILAAREEGGPFASIWDFCERVDPGQVNKRALESLVKGGALDSTGSTRRGMLEVLEDALVSGGRLIADRLAGQSSIFDLGDGEEQQDRRQHHRQISTEEFEKRELLALEKESLGLYVSEHPLDSVRDQLRRKTDCRMSEVERRRDGEVVTVGGIVSAIKQLTTKKGDPMVFLRLDDLSGSLETVVFNSVYAAARELLEADRVLVIKGRVDHKEGETKLIALEIAPFEASSDKGEVRLTARRAQGAGRDDQGAGRGRAQLPGRVRGRARAGDLRRPADLRVRRPVQGAARAGLLRRGEGAPRRSGDPLARRRRPLWARAQEAARSRRRRSFAERRPRARGSGAVVSGSASTGETRVRVSAQKGADEPRPDGSRACRGGEVSCLLDGHAARDSSPRYETRIKRALGDPIPPLGGQPRIRYNRSRRYISGRNRTMPAVELEIQIDPEAELVRAWRIEELVRAGYTPEHAQELADLNHVDLHLATRPPAPGLHARARAPDPRLDALALAGSGGPCR